VDGIHWSDAETIAAVSAPDSAEPCAAYPLSSVGSGELGNSAALMTSFL